jgi:hypothetical protein
MKKLSLEMLRLSTNEILGRGQMKKILGGSTQQTCNLRCGNWTQVMEVSACNRSTIEFYCQEGQPTEEGLDNFIWGHWTFDCKQSTSTYFKICLDQDLTIRSTISSSASCFI